MRLYTTAFMVWISAVLIWFVPTVLLLHRRRYFALGALATGFAAVALLNAVNPDALIVRANVARMQAGERFDGPYLASLSADAVPPLLSSLTAMNAEDREAVVAELRYRWPYPEDPDWRSYNLSRARAGSLVEDRLEAVL